MAEKLTFRNYSLLTPKNVGEYGGKLIKVPDEFGLSQDPDDEKDRKIMFTAILEYAHSVGIMESWLVKTSYGSIPFYMLLMSHKVKRTGSNITQEYREIVAKLSLFVKNPFNTPGTYFSRRESDEVVVVKQKDQIFAFSFPLGTMQA
jgi:hypothetical protein